MITKEFLLSEIKHIESEIPKIQEYLISAQAILSSHKIMIQKIEKDELAANSEVESSPLIVDVD